MTGFAKGVNLITITTRRVIHMTFVKQAGLLRSARSWGVLGLVLALAGMTGSAQGRPPEQPERKPHLCDLTIKTSTQPFPLVSSQPATVRIDVGSIRDSCPAKTLMRDQPPNGLTFTAAPTANMPGWNCYLFSGVAMCDNLSALPANYSVQFTVPATLTGKPGNQITNCATVSNNMDIDPANNQYCVTYVVT